MSPEILRHDDPPHNESNYQTSDFFSKYATPNSPSSESPQSNRLFNKGISSGSSFLSFEDFNM